MVGLNHDTVHGIAPVVSPKIAGLRTHSLASASIRVFVFAVAVQLCFGQANGTSPRLLSSYANFW
jgi:hypothetical protein